MSKEIDRVVDGVEHGRDPLNHKHTHFDTVTESPEKLAEISGDGDGCPPTVKFCPKTAQMSCKQCWLDWLNQPAEEDA